MVRRIAVVGSGAAGAAAVRRLLDARDEAQGLCSESSAACLEVVMLEAKATVGGRTACCDVGSGNGRVPVDLGACWIEGSGKDSAGRRNPMSALADELGVSVDGSCGGDTKEYDLVAGTDGDGCAAQETAVRLHSKAMQRVSTVAHALRADPTLPDSSVGAAYYGCVAEEVARDAALGDPAVQRWVGYYASSKEQYYGTSLQHLSVRYLGLAGSYRGGDRMVSGGYGTVVRRLVDSFAAREGFTLRLECEVLAVEEKTGGCGVVLVLGNGARECFDSVVLTVPLGVLRKGGVAFSPPLPRAQAEAISSIGLGYMNKIVLEFAECFWDDDLGCLQVCGARAGWLKFWIAPFGRDGPPALVCLVGGDNARVLERLSDEAIRAECLQVLGSALGDGPDVEMPEVVSCRVTRWETDRFSGCAYSSHTVGSSPAAIEALAVPLMGGRLLLAGEHTDAADYCSVHGAYNSGVRAAEQVLHTAAASCMPDDPASASVVERLRCSARAMVESLPL